MAKKSKKRRAWTATEVRELKGMARKKTPAGRIAKKLKRSEGATRQKAFSIGLSLDFSFLNLTHSSVSRHGSAPACQHRSGRAGLRPFHRPVNCARLADAQLPADAPWLGMLSVGSGAPARGRRLPFIN